MLSAKVLGTISAVDGLTDACFSATVARMPIAYTDLLPGQRFIADAFRSMAYAIGNHHAVMDWCLYDRCVTPPGAWTPEKFTLYSYPIGTTVCDRCGDRGFDLGKFCTRCGGQSLKLKTYADTNMLQANKLLAPQAFSLTKSLFFLLSKTMSEADQAQLLERYHWELRLGMKSYCMGPLARFPNVCAFESLEPKPFTAPIDDDPALAERNRLWLETQDEERRTQPDFRKLADHVLDIQIPLIIEYEWTFRMDVIGEPFQAETGVNFMGVMEGLAAMGIQ